MTTGRSQRDDQLAYAGPGPTFAYARPALDPKDFEGADVVIVGAPCDLATSYRPGTRFGPRAIRAADIVGLPASRPHPRRGVDPFAVMRIVDHGDVGTFDVVEVNPMVDPAGITALAAHAVVLETMAGMAARRASSRASG